MNSETKKEHPLTPPEITKITAFRTKDNRLFSTNQEAKNHNSGLFLRGRLLRFFLQNDSIEGEFSSLLCSEQSAIVDLVFENKTELIKILKGW